MQKRVLIGPKAVKLAQKEYEQIAKERSPNHKAALVAQAKLFQTAILELERKQQKLISMRRHLLKTGSTIDETQELRMTSREVGEQIAQAKLTLKKISEKI